MCNRFFISLFMCLCAIGYFFLQHLLKLRYRVLQGVSFGVQMPQPPLPQMTRPKEGIAAISRKAKVKSQAQKKEHSLLECSDFTKHALL